MTNKDIQQLIDRYLEGETSPEEEKVLARELLRSDSSPARGEVAEGQRSGSPEWQAIRLMLGELTMGEAEYDAIMAERVNPCQSEAISESPCKSEARMVSLKWRWIAAAASLLLLIGTSTIQTPPPTPPLEGRGVAVHTLPPVVADLKSTTQQTGDLESPSTASLSTESPSTASFSTERVTAAAMNHQEEKIQTPPLTPPLEGRGAAAQSLSPSSPSAEDPNIHYASLETEATTDTVAYQDPARVDEFISKLASVHALPIELTCSATLDSTVTSTVYVFPNKTMVSTNRQEVDIFGRLLQVACCYSDETPGYQLNFSHLQFFFQLKDMRRQLQYLWIAERVNGKILLYSTHSPIGTNVSSACYQEYRDELMHTKSIHTKTLDI